MGNEMLLIKYTIESHRLIPVHSCKNHMEIQNYICAFYVIIWLGMNIISNALERVTYLKVYNELKISEHTNGPRVKLNNREKLGNNSKPFQENVQGQFLGLSHKISTFYLFKVKHRFNIIKKNSW